MSRAQSSLFPPAERRAPRVLMHVMDAGADNWTKFRCATCGRKSEWVQMIRSEANRGTPCLTCNAVAPAERKNRQY